MRYNDGHIGNESQRCDELSSLAEVFIEAGFAKQASVALRRVSQHFWEQGYAAGSAKELALISSTDPETKYSLNQIKEVTHDLRDILQFRGNGHCLAKGLIESGLELSDDKAHNALFKALKDLVGPNGQVAWMDLSHT